MSSLFDEPTSADWLLGDVVFAVSAYSVASFDLAGDAACGCFRMVVHGICVILALCGCWYIVTVYVVEVFAFDGPTDAMVGWIELGFGSFLMNIDESGA